MTFYVPSKQILSPELLVPGNKPAHALRTVSDFDGEFYPFFAEHGTKINVDAASGRIYTNVGTVTHNGGYITVATANTNYVLLKPQYSLSAFTIIIRLRNVSGTANNRVWSIQEDGSDDLRIFINGLTIMFDADDGSFNRLTHDLSSWSDWVTIAITHTGSYEKLFVAEGSHAPLEIVDEASDTLVFTSTTGHQVFFGSKASGTPGAMGGDGEYACFVPDRAMGDDEVIAFAADPYAILAPVPPLFALVTGDAAELDINPADHTHSTDILVLTQAHQLGVDDANHAHTADEIVLQAAAELDINPADHTHSTDILVLTQAHILVLQDSAHAHTADNVVLQSAGTLDIVGGLHAHTADNIDITQAHVLSVADAAHAHAADNVTLDGGAIVVIQDSTHAHAADSLSLAQAHALNIAGALHAHLADNIDVGVDHATLIISDTLHAQLSDQCNVSEQITVIDTPGERIFIIQAEGRVIAVSAGPRAFPIQ